MAPTPRTRRASGFTLIELLVVISVILLLMGLLLPTLSNVQRTARRATCRNNQSQIGPALNNYALSFERYLPPVEDGSSRGYAFDVWKKSPGWVGLGHLVNHGGLSEGDGKIFYCPSLDTRRWHDTMPGYWPALFGHGMYDYRYDAGPWYGWKRVREGTRTIMGYQYRMSGFNEHPSHGGWGRSMSIQDDAERAVVADQLDWRFGPDFCHRNGLNVVFLDGHVVWYHDNARYIETAGYPWSTDAGTAQYEVFWRLFDKHSAGSVEMASLAAD